MKIDIAIIGAGISGLTLAYLLQRKKFVDENLQINVTLFEASSQVGGRIHTLRRFSDKNLYAEAGALTIADNQVEILKLVKELGLNVIQRQDRSKRRYFINQTWQQTADASIIITYLINYIDKLRVENIIQDEKDWISEDISKKELDYFDKISIVSFLQNALENHQLILASPEKLKSSIAQSLLGMYSDDIEQLSAWDALRYLSQFSVTKTTFSIELGNDQLPKALFKSIKPNTILLNSPVTSLVYNNEKIIVNYLSNEQMRTKKFDRVVFAVPLSALKTDNPNRIRCFPSLTKSNIIDQIPYNTSVSRFYWEVESRFWLNENDTAMTITDNPTHWIEDHTGHIPSQHAVLESHGSGPFAKKLLQSKNPENEAFNKMEQVFGSQLRQTCSKNPPMTFFWHHNPYQRGAYPYFSTGQRRYLGPLGENEDKLHFIGDYTDIEQPASMNGAVRSAHRVLKELEKSLLCETTQFKQKPIKCKL